MFRKRDLEGYILIDHRNSPGITPEFIRDNNLDVPAVGAGVTFESAVTVCHSCQRDVILNPNRSRERAWCMQHDAYLCDDCDARRAAGGTCEPALKKIEQIFKQLSRSNLS